VIQVKDVAAAGEAILTEVEKVIVGKRDTLNLLLVGILANGHVLIEDFPGLAKTLIARSLAQVMGLGFRRIQFTPDLLPSDITGSSLYDQRNSEFSFQPGPVFTNLLLGDEINRTPPKTQAALLEAMQERQVTVDGVTRPLTPPFIVIATQNPIEYEGTYQLPEAQLDRFLMKVIVTYPSAAEEETLLKLRHSGVAPVTLGDVATIAGASDLMAARAEVDAVTVHDAIVSYIAALVRRTRELPSVSLGASPRAAVHLLAAAKASACLSGRSYVVPDDVVALAVPVLGHRILLTPEAELDRFTPADALANALSSVPIPR
jgi:MoxR-like ATPase